MTDPDPHALGLMLGRMDAKLDGIKDTLSASSALHEVHSRRITLLEHQALRTKIVGGILVAGLAGKDYVQKLIALAFT